MNYQGLGKCYNCKKNIESNAWQFCPFCGRKILSDYPLPKRTTKHRKTRGDGTVFFDKSKGKYRAKVNGKHIGYFDLKEDAQKAVDIEIFKLQHPEKLDTFEEVFEKWIASKSDEVVKSTYNGYRNAFSYFPDEVKKTPMIEITTIDLDKAFQNAKRKGNEGVYSKIRIVSNGIFEYAIYHGIVEHNLTETVRTPKRKKKKSEGNRFSDEELNILWKHKTDDVIKTILIFCYTGFRPSELFLVKCSDVDIEKEIIVGGIKTEAGKNRRIPIHPKIMPFIKYFLSINNDYLIQNNSGNAPAPIRNNNWRRRKFVPTLVHYGILKDKNDHHLTPKSGRKTFASLCDDNNLKTTAVTRMIGHTDFSTTDEYYIQKSDEELKKEIRKI